MARMSCGNWKGGVKTCRVGTRTVRLHKQATSGTRAKRRTAGKRLQSQYQCQRGSKGRFTKCYYTGPGGRRRR